MTFSKPSLARVYHLVAYLLVNGKLAYAVSHHTQLNGSKALAPATDHPTLLSNQTAEEFLRLANHALTTGDWNTASNALLGFFHDFEDRTETAPQVKKYRPYLVYALIELKQFEEAHTQIDKALRSQPPYPAVILGELQFQAGACSMHLKQFQSARTSFEAAISITESAPRGTPSSPANPRISQSRLLLATCFLNEGKPKEAAAYLSKSRPQFDNRYLTQALTLQFQALVEAESTDEAFRLVLAEEQQFLQQPQAASTQMLLLKLSDNLQAQDRPRQALAALSRIHALGVMLKPQEAATSASTIHSIQDTPPPTPATLPESEPRITAQSLALSVRLRQARAYLSLQRHHEASLILNELITQFPKEPLLEDSALALAQCWCALERWEQISPLAANCFKNYPNFKSRSALLYFKGLAEQKLEQYDESLHTFDTLAKMRIHHEFELRAEFAAAFTQLLANQPDDAAARFRLFTQRHPNHPLTEDAAHWLCLALGFARHHAECRSAADAYLKLFLEGESRPIVFFQKARSAIALKLHTEAVNELTAWRAIFPEHHLLGEATLLLGEVLATQQKTDDAIATFSHISKTYPRPFEEGFFKAATLLQQTGQIARLKSHLLRFTQERPQSPRLADAVLWTMKLEKTEAAIHTDHQLPDHVFTLIRALGNDPEAAGVEPLLEGLFKLQTGAEPRTSLLERLVSEQALASENGKDCLRRRLLWSIGHFHMQSNPAAAQTTLLAGAESAPPDSTSSRLLADFADAQSAAKQISKARLAWMNLLKWHPHAPEEARAFLALANIAMVSDNRSEALSWIARFEKNCDKSPLKGRILLVKARLQESAGDTANAHSTLEILLKERYTPADIKADALLSLADSYMGLNQPNLAIPYYQRVYILYTRWPERVAHAYLRSGEAFEVLGDRAAARRTYQEMQAATLPRLAEAEEHLSALEGLE